MYTKKTTKDRIFEIIFEADTPAGKAFDIILIFLILASVVVVILESVPSIHEEYGTLLRNLEWLFTSLFTIEYVARIYTIKKPFRYIFSFYGIIDFLSIAPMYFSLFFVGSHAFLVIRTIRLLRIFRVLKLVQFLGAADKLFFALKTSLPKIIVFLVSVFSVTIIVGTIMYQVEGSEHGFTSIPRSIYWAIVTMTTVGYGDIAPQTAVGQTIAAFVMILGYGIIAVPTGIVTSEMTKINRQKTNTQYCPNCGHNNHDDDAKFCKVCGTGL